QKMTTTLQGSDWKSIKTVQQKDGIHIYRLNRNGKSIWIAWNDSGVPKPVTLLLDNNIERVTITESVPHYASGKDILHSDYFDTIFQTRKENISKNFPPQLTFKLNTSPVFIEER
ncbi:hypothetical protein VU10_07190, partial [Desulfobulbus sp. US1]|nr:hypothetical protein [Desulfobulbus sp. US1]